MNLVTSVASIAVLAIIVEALIEYTKLIFVNRQINWKQIVSLVLGVAIAVLANADLFAAVGVNFVVPYVGVVLTGIIFSRGSNYVSDFISLIQGKNSSNKVNDIDEDELPVEETTEE